MFLTFWSVSVTRTGFAVLNLHSRDKTMQQFSGIYGDVWHRAVRGVTPCGYICFLTLWGFGVKLRIISQAHMYY